MPRKNKKTPANKKTGISSPIKATRTKKSSKKVTDLDGSFLQLQQLETVSTVPSEIQHHDQQPIDKSDAILAYLQKIDQSNQSLAKRVGELESNRSVSSTPLGPRSQLATSHIHSPQIAQNTQHQASGPHSVEITSVPTTSHVPCASIPGPSTHNVHCHTAVGQQTATKQHLQFKSDGILPSVTALRQNPSVAQTVAEVMATYENQAKQETTIGKGHQGKKSG